MAVMTSQSSRARIGKNASEASRTTAQLVRAGFRMILGTQPDIEVVGEAADGPDAVALAAALTAGALADVAALKSGALLVAAGTSRIPRVLMLTTFDLDEYVYDAL